MRKLYNEYFHIPKDGKIKDKVMIMRVIYTVVIMTMCLAVMSISAYAYFSYIVTSSDSDNIKTANFETNISILDTVSNENVVEVITGNNNLQKILNAGTLYKVTLTRTANSSAKTGFVIITAEDCEGKYHTQQLGVDGDKNTSEITFYIKVSETTNVKFCAHWGTSSCYEYESKNNERYIIDGETIEMTINSIQATPTPTINSTSTLDLKVESTPQVESTITATPTETTESTDIEPTVQVSPTIESIEATE